MNEIELKLNKIASYPQYPTLGNIIKEIADISGYTEKKFDSKKSFRRLLQRLEKQEVGEIDLDNYQDFLFTVLNRFKNITSKLKVHWLDEAQVFHFFYAYQELLKEIPMFAIDQKAINNFVGISFLIWTVRRYIRWVQIDTKNFQNCSKLWILESLNPTFGLETIFKNLKKHLGDEDMSDWGMVGIIHSSEDLPHDKHQDYCKQIKRWIKKGRINQYDKVLELVIEPMRENYSEASQIFEIDFLSWRWLSKWLQYIQVEESSLLVLLNTEFQSALQSTNPENTAIPSREMLLEESRLSDIRKTFESVTKLLKNPTFMEEWVLSNIIPTERWPQVEIENTDVILRILELSEYRHSGDFNEISSALLDSIDDKIPEYISRVFKLRYLHGYIPSNYRDTKSWIDSQRTNAPRLYLQTLSLLILSEEDIKWLNKWDSKTINHFRAFAGVNKTRLMVAAYLSEYQIVKRLLEDGADQFILSTDDDLGAGDNSSALLLSLRALEAPILLAQKENSEQVTMLLLNMMQDTDSLKGLSVLNTRHAITKRVPLNIAIEIGNLAILNTLIYLGSDCNAEIGGEDRTPIYASIEAYDHYKNIKTYNNLRNRLERTTPNIMRMENDPTILRAIEMESGPETTRLLMQAIIDLMNKQKPNSIKPYEDIIQALVEYGADLNKLNSNGWYPLDMAIEIGDHNLIELITSLGAYKKAFF